MKARRTGIVASEINTVTLVRSLCRPWLLTRLFQGRVGELIKDANHHGALWALRGSLSETSIVPARLFYYMFDCLVGIGFVPKLLTFALQLDHSLSTDVARTAIQILHFSIGCKTLLWQPGEHAVL